MTKQSSKYKSAPFGAALLTGLPRYARNDRGARISGITSCYTIYYLCSIIYALIKNGAMPRFFLRFFPERKTAAGCFFLALFAVFGCAAMFRTTFVESAC